MTIGRVLSQSVSRWPDAEALVDDTRSFTYEDLSEMVNRFANGLASMGIEQGDGVGIFARNSIEQIVVYLAVQRLGAVAVPINPRMDSGGLSRILTDADAVGLVCDAGRVDTARAAAADLPATTRLIAADSVDGMRSFDSVLEAGAAEPPETSVASDDPALMMHTSGTTGRPKLVVLSHQSQVINSLSCVYDLNYTHEDRVLHVAPLYHSAGYLNVFLPALHLGATHVLQSAFEPEATLERIEREEATAFLGVPTHFQKLRGTDVSAFDTDSLRMLVTSGAPVQQSTADWVTEHLCETFVNVYGSTEAGGLVTVSRTVENDEETFRIGEPFLNVEVRVIEIGDGVSPDETVDPGERGELIARSPKLMDRYFGRPEKTAETLRDGWLYTGDAAIERDGTYYLVDRIDNLIISGGENIYPQEVEAVLDGHPDIEDCAVVGEPDETFGERVVTYVVSRNPELTLADIDSYWERQTEAPGFKRPRELYLVETIPRNPSGKILRDQLEGGDV
jgi:fatty-acyl-CoA synthase